MIHNLWRYVIGIRLPLHELDYVFLTNYSNKLTKKNSPLNNIASNIDRKLFRVFFFFVILFQWTCQ